MTTAIDIKNALSYIHLLQSIGNCPTMIQAYEDEYRTEEKDEEEDGDSNDVRIFRSQAIFEHTKAFL